MAAISVAVTAIDVMSLIIVILQTSGSDSEPDARASVV
jgi:hypothetical protein